MTAMAYSATMFRRNLRHVLRYPSMIIATLSVPVVMLLLFSYVFGSTIAAGVGGGFDAIDYMVPGLLLMTIASGAVSTAVSIRSDMNEGIVNRFRTMPIPRTSVVTGHVLGSVVQIMASVVLVIAVGMALGFRPTAGLGGWVAFTGLAVLVAFAITWLAVAGVRWFAEYQPYTPIIQTMRGLLIGGPIGHDGWLAVGWGVVLTVGGYLWSTKLFNRGPQR